MTIIKTGLIAGGVYFLTKGFGLLKGVGDVLKNILPKPTTQPSIEPSVQKMSVFKKKKDTR